MSLRPNMQSASKTKVKKVQPESKILASTTRKIIEDSNRDEEEKVKSPTRLPGISEEALKSYEQQKKFFRLKILKEQKEIEVDFDDGIALTVREFKNQYLEEWLQDGIHGARVIYNGRELKDSHQMEEFREDFLKDVVNGNWPIFHIFLFVIADRIQQTQQVMTLKTDPNLGVDFDYFVERNVISEEEVS